jgi:ubiquinone biosynthesis protein
MLAFVQTNFREREILEVVFRHGWGYMQQLLKSGKANQSGSPDIPPPAVLCNILIDLGPVYVKLGQLLSTRPDVLPPAYIDALSRLQADVPPAPWPEIEALIRQELPQSIAAVFKSIDPQPVAAGSIAQTHKAIRTDGQPVALKIQRPGIDAIVARDVALIKRVANLVSVTDFGKQYDIVALASEFIEALQAELDFTQEATYTDRLRSNLAASQWFDPHQIVVPAIDQTLTTPKLLVMQWLDGVPILAATIPESHDQSSAQAERDAITTLIVRAFFQQYLVDGFFHADPHPGNLFYMQDGRVAILDCGMMGRLDLRTQAALVEMVLAIINLDAQRCTQLTLQLAEPMQPVNLARLEYEYDRLLRRYSDLTLKHFNASEAFYEILQAARRNHLRWPSNIGLFAKSLANLEGTGRLFNPTVNIISEVKPLMTDMFRRQLVGDDPLQALLRTALEFKDLSLRSPRQVGFLLNRLSSETFKLNLASQDVERLCRTLDSTANRRSFSTVVGALIIGAAIISSGAQTPQLQLLSNVLFAVASGFGLWLVVAMLRSGNLRS